MQAKKKKRTQQKQIMIGKEIHLIKEIQQKII